MDTVDWLSPEYGSSLCQRDNRKGRESRAWKLINHKREEIREKTGLNREEDDHSGVKRDGLESQLLIDTLSLEEYCRRLFLDVDILLFYFVHEMVLGCQVRGRVGVHSLKEKWLMIGNKSVVDRLRMCYRTWWRSSTLMTFPNSNIAKSSAWRRFWNGFIVIWNEWMHDSADFEPFFWKPLKKLNFVLTSALMARIGLSWALASFVSTR